MKHIIILFLVLTPAAGRAEQFSALVFADANDRWHGRNVPIARESFEQLAQKHFFKLTFVDTDEQFAQQTFGEFDVIVFISANPCELNDEKRTEFESFVHQGGAIVGVHSASATGNAPKRWIWWEDLIGTVFLHHPLKQTGIMSVLEKDHPSCMHLEEKWLWTDEWYEFGTPFPNHLNVVLTVDEKTYKPSEEHAMGDFHPIAWFTNSKDPACFIRQSVTLLKTTAMPTSSSTFTEAWPGR